MTNLTPEEQAVYNLIAANTRITQAQICKSEQWLGIHPIHEDHLNIDKRETTLRRIRQIIRTMRIDKGVPILSDKSGYFLMGCKDEAEKYLKKLEQSSRSSAKSFMVTYESMRNLFGIRSDHFEETNKILVKQHTRRKRVDDNNTKGNREQNQNYLF